MNSKWLKGYNAEEDKEKRRQEVLSFTNAFKELAELLEEKEHTSDYEVPSWACKQAEIIGYNKAIRHVLNLINLK